MSLSKEILKAREEYGRECARRFLADDPTRRHQLRVLLSSGITFEIWLRWSFLQDLPQQRLLQISRMNSEELEEFGAELRGYWEEVCEAAEKVQ